MTDAHLDDEQLSALVDGEATADERAHVEGCARCSARVSAFRHVAAAVGTAPAPPSAPERDRAIDAALAAREVVPFRARRSGLPSWLIAAAVVLVLAAIAIPLLRGDDEDLDAATAGSDASGEESVDDSGAATLETAAPPVFGGDLGPIDATTDLRSAVVLPPATAGDNAPSSSADRTEDDAAAGDAGAGAESAAEGVVSDLPLACEPAVRESAPGLGALLYVATATFDGTPAAVLAFDRPEESQVVVHVVAADDCRILNFTAFAR